MLNHPGWTRSFSWDEMPWLTLLHMALLKQGPGMVSLARVVPSAFGFHHPELFVQSQLLQGMNLPLSVPVSHCREGRLWV